MRNSRRFARVLPAALGLLLAACRGGTGVEDAIAKVPWFTNMRDQPAVEPYEEPPRMPPDGTLPVNAGVPLGATPDDYEGVTNPIPSTPESLEMGKERFDIFCAVCHGPEGRGNGNIEGPFPRGLIAVLDSPRAQQLSDGYIFGMMSVGRGLMPNYRRIPQEERWHIVNYVRDLQRRFGQ